MDNIKKIAASLSKLVEENEKISLKSFAKKLDAANAAYPGDQTIGQMTNIVSRMANGNRLVISRSEIADMYKKLYSRNTKFAEVFAFELGSNVVKLASATVYDRTGDDEGMSIIQDTYEKVVDKGLANSLNSAFGNITIAFNQSDAKNAKSLVEKQLSSVKLSSTVEISSGNEKFIVCRASFETPKGKTSFYVPVEIVASKVLLPSVLIGNDGVKNFSKSNVEAYIVANAGKKLNLNDDTVFNTLNKIGSVEISDVDLALTKLVATKESKGSLDGNNILFQKIAEENKNLVVETVKYNDPEAESFAAQLDTNAGIANYELGIEVVQNGRNIIANKLVVSGFKNAQVKVFSNDKNTIVYAVSMNDGRVSFRVPVKVSGKTIMEPTIVIANGKIESFSKDGIQNLANADVSDFAAFSVASSLSDLKVSELVGIVRSSVNVKEYIKAEEALNMIVVSGDSKAYAVAYKVYTDGLAGKSVVAEKSRCTNIVKNSSSKHELCGHTGLPLHKVYQDKNGNCCPGYRQAMDDTYEGAYLQNGKIFF